jgi:hypothetical protein
MADRAENAGEDGRLPWPLTGAALVAFAALYLTGGRFVGLPVMAIVLLASYATSWRMASGRAMRWGLRIVAFAIITMAVGIPRDSAAMWYFVPGYTSLIGYLLAAELVLPAWQRGAGGWGRRSWGVLLLLSALVMTAATNTYQRPPIHVLAPVYMLLAALSLRAMGRAGAADAPVRVKRLVALRVATVVLTLGLGSAIVMAVTRYDQRIATWAVELLREQRPSRTMAIGFAGAPRLRAIFNPEQSPERALLIEGPPGERHLRVLAFDVYDNTQWGPAVAQRTFAGAGPMSSPAGGQRLRITRLMDALDLLAVPSDATAVVADGALERDEMGALRDHESGGNPPYDVVVRPAAGEVVALGAKPDAARRARALVVPAEVDARVAELARHVAGEGDAATKVVRIQQYLRSNNAYSLSFQPAGEPLSDFVLNKRAAHCQYFASAMVVMARAAGVPARFVTGYYAHEAYGDGRTVVRERDAHAWAECWVDRLGWVTADATPAGGRPDGLFPETPKWRQWWERLKDVPGNVRRWFGRLSRETVIAAIAIPAAVAAGVWVVRFVRMRRRRVSAGGVGYASPRAELLEAGRRFEQWLRRRGLPCAAARTWREHLTSLRGRPSDDWAACLRFVDAYDDARFGGGGDDTVSRVREALDGLEH